MGIDGPVIQLVLLIFDVEGAVPGEELGVAGVPGGHDTVEEIHAPGHALDDVGGRSDTHEIPGLVRRHIGLHSLDDIVHGLGGLPHRQAADGVAVTVQLGDLLHVPDPQIGIGAALIDAEEHLMGVHRVGQGVEPVVLSLAPLQPAEGTLTRGLYILIGGRVFDALIKGHGDVRAQIGLNTHGLLRTHEDTPAIDVGGKGNALFRDLPQPGEGKDLKAAGVGEDRAVPVHEFVKSSQLPHHIVSGTQVEVVGVGELDLAADLLEVMGGDCALDGALRTNIHENRGLNYPAVGTGKLAAPGTAFGFDDFEHVKTPILPTGIGYPVLFSLTADAIITEDRCFYNTEKGAARPFDRAAYNQHYVPVIPIRSRQTYSKRICLWDLAQSVCIVFIIQIVWAI